jgi:hypothetical protein
VASCIPYLYFDISDFFDILIFGDIR